MLLRLNKEETQINNIEGKPLIEYMKTLFPETNICKVEFQSAKIHKTTVTEKENGNLEIFYNLHLELHLTSQNNEKITTSTISARNFPAHSFDVDYKDTFQFIFPNFRKEKFLMFSVQDKSDKKNIAGEILEKSMHISNGGIRFSYKVETYDNQLCYVDESNVLYFY